MDRPLRTQLDPRIQEFSRLAREVFGTEKAAQLMQQLPPDPMPPPAAPRDAGKFVRQLASLYCLPSQEGENARACVAVIIRHALELVNLISEANPEPKP